MSAIDEELVRTAELCAALGCGQIRIFGGGLGGLRDGAGEPDRPEAARRLVERAAELAARARQLAAVDLLIETHDSWTASAEMGRVLAAIGRTDVVCCWDIKHTWWAAGEVPATSWANLSAWVRNTHWKDARRWWSGTFVDERTTKQVRSTGRLGNLGEGVMPALDALDLLLGHGYSGWYTLESEKRWHPYLDEPDTAFPAFVSFMQNAEARWRAGLG